MTAIDDGKAYREVPKDRVLRFKATPGFKGWERFFTEESKTHPAKMNLNLLGWILGTYTKPGDVVLDPMAGTGSTIILAALMGRHGVAVEYEPRFCDMIRRNIELTERQATLTPKGRMACIQGDARELSQLLAGADAIVTSPPYGNRLADSAVHDGDPARMSYRQTIDVVLTSPPFGPSQRGGGIFKEGYRRVKDGKVVSDPTLPFRHGRPLSDDPRNIDNLPYDENIGNLTGETYLEAMLKVYMECYKVLTPGGVMVVVVKNFIRYKQVVRLDLDTIKLCEAAGFRLADRWYFRLPTRSFWRILYHRKHPEVPEIRFEDVLVFEKLTEVKP